jgi:hypothetical protein
MFMLRVSVTNWRGQGSWYFRRQWVRPSAVRGAAAAWAVIVADWNVPIFRRRAMSFFTPSHHSRNFV